MYRDAYFIDASKKKSKVTASVIIPVDIMKPIAGSVSQTSAHLRELCIYSGYGHQKKKEADNGLFHIIDF